MAQTDIIQWANYIRTSMAFDPGRQYFDDHIQKHGFDFLDDYLDSILAKTKEDDVVDLLKTPGRKKTSKSKTVIPSSKLKNIISQEEDREKENAPSLNNLQKALLQAKAEDELSHTSSNPLQPTNTIQLQQSPALRSRLPTKSDYNTPEGATSSPPPPIVHIEVAPKVDDSAPAPIELSMIAEDDESAERSQIVPSHSSPSFSQFRATTETQREELTTDLADLATVQPANMSSSSSTETFHTVSLNSPRVSTRLSPTQEPHTTDSLVDVFMQDEKASPAAPPTGEKPTRESSPLIEKTIPLRDEEEASLDPSLQPAFSGLPGLRKSLHTSRDPSVGTILGAATPGAVIGKRTSWLMKAREAKAMEGRSTYGAAHEGASSKRKSSIMLGNLAMGSGQSEDEERKSKASKQAVADVAPLKATSRQEHSKQVEEQDMNVEKSEATEQLGMLDQFKKTVQGLGFGKTKGKSLGGTAAVNALAEAKALAEARVAERIQNEEEELTRAMGPAVAPATTSLSEDKAPEPVPPQENFLLPADSSAATLSIVEDEFLEIAPLPKNDGRLSISDLVLDSGRKPKEARLSTSDLVVNSGGKQKEVFQPSKMAKTVTAPTSVFTHPSGPVFNKPPPVFIPPSPLAKSARKEDAPPLLPTKFSKPPSMSVGLSPSLRSTSAANKALSAQSTWESIQSDPSENIFSSQEAPSWLPSTQETEYESQPQTYPNQLDDDDSWPLQDQIAGGMQWTFSGRDSTWSSSETNHTEKVFPEHTTQTMPLDSMERQTSPGTVPGAFDMEIDDIDDEIEAGDISIDPSKSTVSLVDPKLNRSQSQLSMASTSSSQSNVGVFGQATKFVNNFLGTSKKGKTEVKSLQLAAAAAKREQEERDKKASVLKNMEVRRQQAIQRKAEEEKNRQFEEEKKMKEEVERRKREREEHTDKRPLKIANTGTSKKEEDTTLKRKLVEVKKPIAKVVPLPNSKSAFKPTQKASALTSSATANALHASTSSTIAGPSNKVPTVAVPKSRAKTPAKVPIPEDDIAHPSQHVQSQMAARVKAQLEAARPEPAIPSESIELPDVDSEYSDSEDEDRVKKFDPPHWAQSPELRQALVDQSSINPDNIFGPIRPLRMEEIFRSRGNRFRARTSSANWVGTDQLTLEEERDYARRMGFE